MGVTLIPSGDKSPTSLAFSEATPAGDLGLNCKCHRHGSLGSPFAGLSWGRATGFLGCLAGVEQLSPKSFLSCWAALC